MDKKQLGLYWGKEAFYFVEAARGQPETNVQVRFDTSLGPETGQKIPESLRFSALIQKAVRDGQFASKKVNLAVAAKDLIYRSFVIPFMQPAEVKNVVDFEVTKYIPISLEDLVYTFHAVPFTENEQKNLRILFVAVRKNVLEKQINILQQAGLEVENIEPASVSLARLLQKNGQIPHNDCTAILEFEKDGGQIVIVEKDIVQFVREFQTPFEQDGGEAVNTKLFNELRVSVNFHQRQNAQSQINRIVVLSATELTALSKGLAEEFKAHGSAHAVSKILKTGSVSEPGFLAACGAAIRDKAVSTRNFDLSAKPPQSLEYLETLKNYKILAGVVLLSIFAVAGTVSIINWRNADDKKRFAQLKGNQGIFESSTAVKIDELKTGIAGKLAQYKDVRAKSDVGFYLQRVPDLLPPGAWLSSLNIEYYDAVVNSDAGPKKTSHLSLTLDGYIYLPNTTEQFRQVNNFVTTLKKTEDFTKSFRDIDLAAVKQDTIGNHQVTYFKITCK